MPEEIQTIGRRMTPKSTHPDYAAGVERRALSLALAEGSTAIRADAGALGFAALQTATDSSQPLTGRRWFWPDSPEELDVDPTLGASLYERRVRGLRVDNVYAESIRSTAAMPFSAEVMFAGWPAVAERRLRGEEGGVDGRGSGITDFYRVAFETKLFAGLHYLRIGKSGDWPIWYQLDADSLRDWEWTYLDGRFRLLGAVVDTGSSRLTYNTLADMSVAWEEYIHEGKDGNRWVLKDSGRSAASQVPIIPFYCEWKTPFWSPPRFEDAADTQAEAIRARSRADNTRRKASCSDTMVIAGWKWRQKRPGDASGEPHGAPRIPRAGSALVFEDDVRTAWQAIDASNLEYIRDDIKADLESVRRQCLDPLRQTVEGDVKATEINFHGRRSQSYIEALVRSDMATLRTALGMTVEMLGLPVPAAAQCSMSPEFHADQRQGTVDRVAGWAEKGLVSKEFFLETARRLTPDIPEELWEEEVRRRSPAVAPDPERAAATPAQRQTEGDEMPTTGGKGMDSPPDS